MRRSFRLLLWALPCALFAGIWAWRGGAQHSATPRTISRAPAVPDAAPKSLDEVASETSTGSRDKLSILVQGIAVGPREGTSALLRAVALTSSGGIERSKLTHAILLYLLDDVAQGAPRLKNPQAVSFALLSDRFPTLPVLELAARYKAVQTDAPRLRVHAELQDLLEGWPLSQQQQVQVKGRVRELQATLDAILANPGARQKARELLSGLLDSGRFADRAVALEACTNWLRNCPKYQSLIGPVVDALFGTSPRGEAVIQVLVLAEGVQAEAGFELAHAGASTLGMELSIRLREQSHWSTSARLGTVQILGNLNAGPDSLGGAVTQATALGGANDGDAIAIGKLGELCRQSHHRTVRQTALVNVGSVTNLRNLIAETKASVKAQIPDMETALQQSDFFAAIHNVLRRHPEDVPAALNLYRQALTQWKADSPMGRELVSDVLLGLGDLRLPETRELLESLVYSSNKYVRVGAKAALKKLGSD